MTSAADIILTVRSLRTALSLASVGARVYADTQKINEKIIEAVQHPEGAATGLVILEAEIDAEYARQKAR